LFLEHTYSGVELQLEYARDTLENLYRLWDRPVHLQTALEDMQVTLSFDGTEHEMDHGDVFAMLGDGYSDDSEDGP